MPITGVLAAQEEPDVCGQLLLTNTTVYTADTTLLTADLVSTNRWTGTVVSGPAFVAPSMAVASPAFGVPVFAQQHVLTAAFTLSSPVLGIGFTAAISNFVALNYATSAPSFGPASFNQICALAATSIATGVPVLGAGSLGQAGVLAGLPLIVQPYALGVGALGQTHILLAQVLTTGPPALATPALGVVVNALAAAIVVQSPTLGQPAITKLLSAVDLTATSPTIGQSALGKIFAPLGFALTPPAIGAPAIVQAHIFSTNNFATASPLLPQLFVGGLVGDLVICDYAIDNGLAALAGANKILACLGAPTDYANAITLTIAEDVATFGPPQHDVGGGRKITSSAVTRGLVTGSGTPSRWVAVDTVNARVLAHGRCTGGALLTPSVAWTLDPIIIVQDGVP